MRPADPRPPGPIGVKIWYLPGAERALPGLGIKAVLQGSDSRARKRACEAASYLDPLPPELAPVLICDAQEGDAEKRLCGIVALIHAGAEAKDAIPLLITAVKDPSVDVWLPAAEALRNAATASRCE